MISRSTHSSQKYCTGRIAFPLRALPPSSLLRLQRFSTANGPRSEIHKQSNIRLHYPLHCASFIKQRQSSSCRHASTYASFRSVYRRSPVASTLAAFCLLTTSTYLLYITFFYYPSNIISPYLPYPDSVTKPLRKAVYYTSIDLRPKDALKFYKQALQAAKEAGMDMESTEVLGIRLEVGRMLEKAGQLNAAIEVVEQVRKDVIQYLQEIERTPNAHSPEQNTGTADSKEQDTAIEDRTRRRRMLLLMMAIRTSCQLGSWYADPSINAKDRAEERLVWGVTALLRERKRREDDGVQKGEENGWFVNEEVGSALESLADYYAERNQHFLSTPLYLQAIPFNGSSCHAVTLMNNLASSLVLQNPGKEMGTRSAGTVSTGPPASATNQISSATQWALKALKLGQSVHPPDRTRECDEACAVATINLGDFAAMEGNIEEAKRRWEEGKSISAAIGMRTGVRKAEEGLRRLEKKT